MILTYACDIDASRRHRPKSASPTYSVPPSPLLSIWPVERPLEFPVAAAGALLPLKDSDRKRVLVRALDETPQDCHVSGPLRAVSTPKAKTPEPEFREFVAGDAGNWDSDSDEQPALEDVTLDLMPAGANAPPLVPPAPIPPPIHVQPVDAEVFIPAGPDPDPDPWVDAEGNEVQPLGIPAMQEEPYIRLAYLQAVMGNVFGKLTWEHATQQLNNTLDILALADRLPVHPRPVRTLQSARQRLGIDPDQYIIQYSLCPVCWKHHTPQELKDLASPNCSARNCTGKIYTLKDGHRDPVLILPRVSLIGFAALVERRPHHQPGRNSDEDFIMKDMPDGKMWYYSTTRTKREVGNLGTVRDTPNSAEELPTKLFSHRFGLQLTLNTDWFGALSGRPHSTGPVYWSINNLPREFRYLQVNVPCTTIMPGPKEPNTEQLNNALEPDVRELKQLKNGVKMDIYGEAPAEIFADSHKFNGSAGHSHDFHPCPYCNVNILDVDLMSGYDDSPVDKDDFHLLKHAFKSRGAGPQRQMVILRDRSVQWAIFNTISNWLPASKTVLDFMHNIFLGIICHFFMEVIFKSYMLSGAGGSNSPKQHFKTIINSVRWPSHITRLPKNLGKNQSLKKADEWRRLLTITPVILWWAWRDADDNILIGEPIIPPNAKSVPEHSRNYHAIYSAVLKL
ncbi:hypothetical protein BDZ94DRAFT_1371533 [Collybia nuda]|uniref:Uncharacterized protein n=1 Tax=Collybia nuda TaxID=64659 RepID=A0A9P6CD78_9AGAR|nr:hypothetical protein BDZ94DRAFT_1371533 [Collybia nuda]